MRYDTRVKFIQVEPYIDTARYLETNIITDSTTVYSNTYEVSAEEELKLYGSITNTHKVSIIRGTLNKPFTHLEIQGEYYKVVSRERFAGKTAYTLELIHLEVSEHEE